MFRSFRDLLVWQKAMQLTQGIYVLTRKLPKEELFGLVSQMRRAAVSIPANIAEGHARNSAKEFANFMAIAKGSTAELATQLEICSSLSLLPPSDTDPLLALADEITRMLTSLSFRLSPPPSKLKTQLSHLKPPPSS